MSADLCPGHVRCHDGRMLDLSTVVLVLVPPRSPSRKWCLVAMPNHVARDGHFGEARTEQELWDLFRRARSRVDGSLDECIWVVGADGRTQGRVFENEAELAEDPGPDCDRTRLASVA